MIQLTMSTNIYFSDCSPRPSIWTVVNLDCELGGILLHPAAMVITWNFSTGQDHLWFCGKSV